MTPQITTKNGKKLRTFLLRLKFWRLHCWLKVLEDVMNFADRKGEVRFLVFEMLVKGFDSVVTCFYGAFMKGVHGHTEASFGDINLNRVMLVIV